MQADHASYAHKFPRPEYPFSPMYPASVPVADWSTQQDMHAHLTPYNWLYIQTITG